MSDLTFARRAPAAPLRSQRAATPTRRDANVDVRSPMPASGAPLAHGTRDFMERRFGHDFSRVRVHAGSAAAASARSASAQAYTVGNDIVFGAGLYNSHSTTGNRLLAHELAHVVQQQLPSRETVPGAAHESEANVAADRVASGEQARVGRAAPVSMQRQPVPGALPDIDLTQSASPLMAAAIGSVTLDGFKTGKDDISPPNQPKLAHTVDTIFKLLKRYPASKIHVVGYTDAVGQESDNQVLGQARADRVHAALVDLGIPDVAIVAESRGAGDLLVKTGRAEARNRRVEVRFEPSTRLRGAMSEGLTLTPQVKDPAQGPAGAGQAGSDLTKVCLRNPALCYGGGMAPRQGLPPGALQPIPDITPYGRMDVGGANDPYTSHGQNPQGAGDLRQTWAQLYWKYRRLGLSESLAAKAADSELSSTAGKAQSRDNPNTEDRLDQDMQHANPNATKVGPASATIFRF